MFETIETFWQKFKAQPRNLHLLLAVALLVLVLTITLTVESGEQAAVFTDIQVTPEGTVVVPALAAETPTIIPAAVPTTTVPTTIPTTIPTTVSTTIPPVVMPGIATTAPVRLVLIIDDIGYNAEAGQRAINLPGQVTYAVIPFTPHGKILAESAHAAQKEVMLHAPMSNLSGIELGQGGLTLLQDENEFLYTLRMALTDIPHIKGVNNHTGSELTAVVQPMQWVMQELKLRGLYFVDSVTTSASVAGATAEQYQVPALRRHVFLDNVQTAEAIDIQFKRALALAQKQGFAVAIAHPYPQTLAYLESALATLEAQNIKLVSASTMITELHIAQAPATVPQAAPATVPQAAPATKDTTAAW
jgi:hypothetical protein